MRMSNFVKKELILLLTCIGLLFSSLHAKNWRDYRTGVITPTPEEIKKFPKYRLATTLLAQALPTAVDNSDGLPPVGDQGRQNNCVGWAVGYYAKTYQEGREHGWDLTLDTHQFSPAFLYNHNNSGQDKGLSTYYTMNFIAGHGCATLAEMPYNQEDYLSWPSAIVYKNALQYRAASSYMIERKVNPETGQWENYSDEDLAIMKHILANGNVFVVDIPMDSVLGSLNSLNDVCDTLIASTVQSTHSLCVVGYDDTKGKYGSFKVVNSWGTGWGKDGYGWVGYNVIKFMNNVVGCSGTGAYVMEDRVDYTPTAYARVNLNQAHRGNLRLTLLAMDSNTQAYAETLFENWGGDYPGFDWYFDISDFKNFLPPDADHRYTLSLVDMDSDNNITSLNDFYIEYQGSVYRPEQDSFEGIDFGPSQTSIAGANVPHLTPIGGYMGGIIPKKLSPYLAVSTIEVLPWFTKSLTIEPGTTIYFADTCQMAFYKTKAYIKGTETDTIRFLPFNNKPYKGVWDGLSCGFESAEIEYCDIQYARVGIYITSTGDNDPSSITIKNCSIRECKTGIQLYKSPEDATIISGNRLEQNDTGIGSDDAKYLLKNNLIVSDQIGIDAYTGTPKVVNNTIVGDSERGYQAVYLRETQNTELRNNIIAYHDPGIFGSNANGTVCDYNDVWTNLNGATNYYGVSKGAHDISVDPQFINLQAGDFRLKRTSPCLDVGDPTADYSNEPEPNGGRINLGAYGNTIWATISSGPEIAVSKDSLIFGDVALGEIKTLFLEISNIGTTDLDITGISLANDEIYSVSYVDRILVPNDSFAVKITFSPKAELTYRDSLVILSNARTIKIGILGKGIVFRPFLVYPGNINFSDTTGNYNMLISLNESLGRSMVKFIYKVNESSVFKDTVSCIYEDGKYKILCRAYPMGTVLEYFIVAECASGAIFTLPENAPQSTFRLIVVAEFEIGDVNQDHSVNIFDLLELLKNLSDPTAQFASQNDVNGDKKVDIFDLLALLKLLRSN